MTNANGGEYHYGNSGYVRQQKVSGVNATPVQTGTFGYDDQSRLINGQGQAFGWRTDGRLDSFAGVKLEYDPDHLHAVRTMAGQVRYAYNANGSMTMRNDSAGRQQTLQWDSHNRLVRVTGGGLSGVDESYLYDESGQRLRKIDHLAGVSTFYPFDGYEQTGAGYTVRHYRFGGRTVAVRSGASGSLAFLYGDGVGSTVYATDAGAATLASRGYTAFGALRRSAGAMPTDQRFTGQREDASGLYYMNARYYDPLIGHFISPDTLVPDPAQLSDYNRYLYGYGNPVKYSDPTGHYSVDELQQHFGVGSFDELMALFEEGGAYAGLEGWYDILRYAQDGDTIIATNANKNMGLSFTGTFMRTADGRIQIDMGGSLGIAPEISFAHFGGLVRNTEGNVTDFGAYELWGQEYAWRAAIAGGRRHGDMASCANVDCIAATFDFVGVVGSGIQVASPLCTGFVAACAGTGKTISWIATGGGLLWTGYNAWIGNATAIDLSMNITTAATGTANKNPVVGLGAGVVQWIWDTEISPYQR